MKITPEMMAEDEQRWHARDVIMELGYCGNAMRDRKDITNLDIRFYAYIMRKAHEMLKAREPRVMTPEEVRKCAINKDPVFVEWSVGEPSWIAMTVEMVADLMKSGNTNLRVWSSRPSPEQMRDTPWEGENDG